MGTDRIVHNGAVDDHLSVEGGLAREQAGEVAKVRVRVLHHGRDGLAHEGRGEVAGKGVCGDVIEGRTPKTKEWRKQRQMPRATRAGMRLFTSRASASCSGGGLCVAGATSGAHAQPLPESAPSNELPVEAVAVALHANGMRAGAWRSLRPSRGAARLSMDRPLAHGSSGIR